MGDGLALRHQFPGKHRRSLCSIPAGAVNPPAQKLPLSAADRTRAQQAYDYFGLVDRRLRNRVEVSPFTSKFDAYLSREATLAQPKSAVTICSAGRRIAIRVISTAVETQKPGEIDTACDQCSTPVYRLYLQQHRASENLALPWYSENNPDQLGFTPIRWGRVYRRRRRAFSRWLLRFAAAQSRLDRPQSLLCRQVPDIDLAQCRSGTPPPPPPNTAFVKAFMHNGYLLSLKEVVHFYNTRDKFAFHVHVRALPGR